LPIAHDGKAFHSRPEMPTYRPKPAGPRWPPRAGAGPAPPPDKPPGQGRFNVPPRRAWWTFLILLVVNYVLVRTLFPGEDAAITIPYTAFKQEVASGNVEAIYSQGASIEGRFRSAVTWPPRAAASAPASSAAASASAEARPIRERW
jgi:hypothetical protein